MKLRKISWQTLKGKGKKNAEDHILIGNDTYILADGATYSRSPELASFLIVAYSMLLNDLAKEKNTLEEIIRKTREMIETVAPIYRPLNGVASTLDILYVDSSKKKGYYAHTGNGRIFTLDSNKNLKNIFSDKREVEGSYIGLKNPFFAAEIGDISLDSINAIAIMSDGATSCITETELKEVLIRFKEPKEAVKAIIEYVKQPKKAAHILSKKRNLSLENATSELSQHDDASVIVISGEG